MSDLFSNVYNPDVLSCLANLSNDAKKVLEKDAALSTQF